MCVYACVCGVRVVCVCVCVHVCVVCVSVMCVCVSLQVSVCEGERTNISQYDYYKV